MNLQMIAQHVTRCKIFHNMYEYMILKQYGLDCLDECIYLERAREAHKAQKLINYSDTCAIPNSALCIIDDYYNKKYDISIDCKSTFTPSTCFIENVSSIIDISNNDVVTQILTYTGPGYSDYTETSLDKITWSGLSSIDIQSRSVTQVTGAPYNIQSDFVITNRPDYTQEEPITVSHTLSILQWQGLRNALLNVKPFEVVRIRLRGNTRTYTIECYGAALVFSVSAEELSIGCKYGMREYHPFSDVIAESHNSSLELRQASNVSSWSTLQVDEQFHTFELTKYSLSMPPMYGYIRSTISKPGCDSIVICSGVTWEQKYSGGDFVYTCECPDFVPTSYAVVTATSEQVELGLYVNNPSGQYKYEDYLSYNPLGIQVPDEQVFDPNLFESTAVIAFSYKLDCNQTNYIYVYVK